MSGVKLGLVVTVLIVVKVQTTPSRVNPVVIEGNNGQRSCPSSDTLESARNDLKEDILPRINPRVEFSLWWNWLGIGGFP